ncbi:lycopene cyclase family protein [Rhodococcus sp. ABRD24]|nr:lycopene cyclase family protein [Rhodococcus sp. ABRD24]
MIATPAADLAVVGLGPAGRALAHRAAAAGLRTVGVDPRPDRPWAPTYAAWVDELPSWLSPGVLRTRVAQPRVWATQPRTLDREYGVLDNPALHRTLDLSAVQTVTGTAAALGRGVVTLRDGTEIRAARVIDARGLRADPALAEQTAYGVVLPSAVAAPAMGGAECWFMDWRRDNGTSPGDPPSFLYAVPLGGDSVLLEETCLVGRPGLPLDTLRRRLDVRLRNRGVEVAADADFNVERVRFPVEAPRLRTAVMTFGARAGLIHPGTGYSVAASLRAVDDVVTALTVGADPAKALWPYPTRAVRSLREIGLRALLHLNPAFTAEFFDRFFALPTHRQRAYLSGREHPAATAATMWELFRTAPMPIRRTLAAASVRRS